MRMFSDALAEYGPGDATVQNAIQAPTIRAPPGSDLQLESLTRNLSLRAPKFIHLESRAGNIDVTAHRDIKFASDVGAIRIEAQNIIISDLKKANTTTKPQKNTYEHAEIFFKTCTKVPSHKKISLQKGETNESIYEKYDPLLHGNTRSKKDQILSTKFMRKYIHIARLMKPKLTQEASDTIADEYAKLRNQDTMDSDVARVSCSLDYGV
ncbi:hypothetical protein evm_015362 [Chilo suppressalis]|nr:hypothetical protein evm_015362 [Chilo suppressalis]